MYSVELKVTGIITCLVKLITDYTDCRLTGLCCVHKSDDIVFLEAMIR